MLAIHSFAFKNWSPLRDDGFSTGFYTLLDSYFELCGDMLRGLFEAEARLTVLVSALTAATAALGEAG